jgi:predicted DNA-binding protein with PD1-like motif
MNKVYQVSVLKGEEVKEKIYRFILEKRWEAAVIVGAVGSIRDVVYTTPEGNADNFHIVKNTYTGPAELLSFTGEIMKAEKVDPMLKKVYTVDGEYFIHAHASSAGEGGVIRGGGFQEGHALRAVNVFIQQLES